MKQADGMVNARTVQGNLMDDFRVHAFPSQITGTFDPGDWTTVTVLVARQCGWDDGMLEKIVEMGSYCVRPGREQWL